MGRSDRKRSRSPSDRRSRRSRSPDSSRSKNRDKDCERDKDKDRDRRRSPNSSSSHRSSSHYSSSSSQPTSSKRPRESSSTTASESAPNREKLEDIVGRQSYKNFDIEKQKELLDKVMQERRERVEKWRTQQKILGSTLNGEDDVNSKANDSTSTKQQSFQSSAPEDSSSSASQDKQQPNQDGENEKKEKKKWSLDDELDGDDDDDDEEMNGEPDGNLVDDKDEHGNERELLAPKRQQSKDDEDSILQVEKPKPIKSGRRRFTDAPTGSVHIKSSNNDSKLQDVEMEQEDDRRKVEETKSEEKNEEVTKKEEEEEDEVDPLDAFMLGIQEEVKKNRKQIVRQSNSKVSVVVGIANRKRGESKRGERLEENDDNFGAEDGAIVSNEEDLAIALVTLNQAKAKKPQTIAFEDITYMPFRKDFYIEVPEIAAMSKQDVETMRTEMEGIKTKGKGCPRPIRTWAQCGVNRKVLETLKKSGFEKPTPIQCQAIPVIMSGRDMIGIAKTGSGKTMAFLLPMFRHILDQPPLEPGDGPIAVIMTPTRELAVQIFIQCRKFAKPMGLRTVAVYGGTPISEQIGDLKPGTEIVVCTPGRMIDMLAANSGRVTNLKRCTYIVLDEADRMFDMGFEPQVMKIIDGIRPDRQTVMFSATFPRIMESLARRILDKPIEVLVGGRSIVCKDIQQNIVVIDNDDKFLKLLEILGKFANDGSAICFVDKQEHADWLLKELMLASYTALALHGGVDQSDRDSTIADFKAGKVNVLVATSVAARGLDVKHCIVVVNYDCPNHYEDYVHRCGRTGRAGNKGYAYTFVTPDQGRYSLDLIKALQLSETDVPDDLQKLFDEYKMEQEALGKKVKSSSGFSGKGFKFDEAEAAAAVEKKKAQKAALGILDSDDEDEDGEKKAEGGDALDAEIESLLGAKKKAVPVANNTQQQQQQQQSSTPSSTTSTPAANAQTPLLSTPLHLLTPITPIGMDKSMDAKMEQVRRAASKISMLIPNLSTNSGIVNDPKPTPTSHTAAILKGDSLLGDLASATNAKSLAEQRAEALNAKLNYAPRDEEMPAASAPAPPSVNPFQRYEAELEINDFPQQARWRVTGKETIAQISEISEAGITVRGSFVPPGKEPGLGERKLYLAIEAMSERAIDIAKAEIIRIIKEEMARASTSTQQFKGRYKVL